MWFFKKSISESRCLLGFESQLKRQHKQRHQPEIQDKTGLPASDSSIVVSGVNSRSLKLATRINIFLLLL